MAIEDHVPEKSALAQHYEAANYKDCYSQRIALGNIKSPGRLFQEMLFPTPIWISVLMRMRNFIVRFFGLQTASNLTDYTIQSDEMLTVGGKIGFFKIEHMDDNEVVVSANDRHLDSSFSLFVTEEVGGKKLFFTSIVTTKQRFGDIYMFVIAPFHRLIVKKLLRRLSAA